MAELEDARLLKGQIQAVLQLFSSRCLVHNLPRPTCDDCSIQMIRYVPMRVLKLYWSESLEGETWWLVMASVLEELCQKARKVLKPLRKARINPCGQRPRGVHSTERCNAPQIEAVRYGRGVRRRDDA